MYTIYTYYIHILYTYTVYIYYTHILSTYTIGYIYIYIYNIFYGMTSNFVL